MFLAEVSASTCPRNKCRGSPLISRAPPAGRGGSRLRPAVSSKCLLPLWATFQVSRSKGQSSIPRIKDKVEKSPRVGVGRQGGQLESQCHCELLGLLPTGLKASP